MSGNDSVVVGATTYVMKTVNERECLVPDSLNPSPPELAFVPKHDPDSGRTFYVNLVTRAKSWSLPDVAELPKMDPLGDVITSKETLYKRLPSTDGAANEDPIFIPEKLADDADSNRINCWAVKTDRVNGKYIFVNVETKQKLSELPCLLSTRRELETYFQKFPITEYSSLEEGLKHKTEGDLLTLLKGLYGSDPQQIAREILIATLQFNEPEKLNTVEATLAEWEGHEREFIDAIKEEYKELPMTYRQRVALLYAKYNPGKLATVDETLKSVEGRECQLIVALVRKYGPEAGELSRGSTPVATSNSVAEYRARAEAMYQRYNPEKLDTIDDGLKRFEGQEELFIEALVRKYGPEPNPPPRSAPSPTLSVQSSVAPSESAGPPSSVPNSARGDESATTAADDPKLADYKKRVQRMYETYAPEKLANVDRALKMYKGQEDLLIASLVKKYGAEPGSNTPTPRDENSPRNPYRARVEAMYDTYAPHKKSTIEQAMNLYVGREDQLIAALVRKYGPEPKPEADQKDDGNSSGEEDGEEGGGKSTKDEHPLTYAERIERFYVVYNYKKRHTTKTVLKAYAGQEERMMMDLMRKYGPEPTEEEYLKALAEHEGTTPKPAEAPTEQPAPAAGEEEPRKEEEEKKEEEEEQSPAAAVSSDQPVAADAAAEEPKQQPENTLFERLKRFYAKHCPEKAWKIPGAVAKAEKQNNEEKLMNLLIKTYGPEPSADEELNFEPMIWVEPTEADQNKSQDTSPKESPRKEGVEEAAPQQPVEEEQQQPVAVSVTEEAPEPETKAATSPAVVPPVPVAQAQEQKAQEEQEQEAPTSPRTPRDPNQAESAIRVIQGAERTRRAKEEVASKRSSRSTSSAVTPRDPRVPAEEAEQQRLEEEARLKAEQEAAEAEKQKQKEAEKESVVPPYTALLEKLNAFYDFHGQRRFPELANKSEQDKIKIAEAYYNHEQDLWDSLYEKYGQASEEAEAAAVAKKRSQEEEEKKKHEQEEPASSTAEAQKADEGDQSNVPQQEEPAAEAATQEEPAAPESDTAQQPEPAEEPKEQDNQEVATPAAPTNEEDQPKGNEEPPSTAQPESQEQKEDEAQAVSQPEEDQPQQEEEVEAPATESEPEVVQVIPATISSPQEDANQNLVAMLAKAEEKLQEAYDNIEVISKRCDDFRNKNDQLTSTITDVQSQNELELRGMRVFVDEVEAKSQKALAECELERQRVKNEEEIAVAGLLKQVEQERITAQEQKLKYYEAQTAMQERVNTSQSSLFKREADIAQMNDLMSRREVEIANLEKLVDEFQQKLIKPKMKNQLVQTVENVLSSDDSALVLGSPHLSDGPDSPGLLRRESTLALHSGGLFKMREQEESTKSSTLQLDNTYRSLGGTLSGSGLVDNNSNKKKNDGDEENLTPEEKERLRVLEEECGKWENHCRGLETEIETLKKRMEENEDNLTQRNSELASEADTATRVIVVLKSKMAKLNERIEELELENLLVSQTNADHARAAVDAALSPNSTKQAVDRLQAEAESLRQQLADTKAQSRAYKNEITDLRGLLSMHMASPKRRL